MSVTVDEAPLPLEGVHSPSGFEWGYQGSGPAELARAVLRHHLADRTPHPHVYQRFKVDVIAKLPPQGWTLTTATITTALRLVMVRIGRRCSLCADSGFRIVPGDKEATCECEQGRRAAGEFSALADRGHRHRRGA